MEKKNIGALSAQDVDTAISDLWFKVLRISLGEEIADARPELGNYVNLIIPQLRVTYSIFYNPNLIATTYYSALETARRHIISIHERLGFDIEEFQKVSSWSKTVAYEAFEALNSIVYDPVAQILKKGRVGLIDVDPQKKMFLIEMKLCGECWGIPNLNLKACQYTSGFTAGIFSAMMGIDIGVYETKCIAQGDDSCLFKIQPIIDMEHYDKVNEYLSINPREMYHAKDVVKDVGQYLINALEGRIKRPKYGDTVHLFDYQLRLLNSLSIYPKEHSIAYYHAGFRFGEVLSEFLGHYYKIQGGDLLKEIIPNVYRTLGFALVESVETKKDGFRVTMREVADCAGLPEISPHEFICGELAGIASEVKGHRMKCINTKCRDGEDKICEFEITS